MAPRLFRHNLRVLCVHVLSASDERSEPEAESKSMLELECVYVKDHDDHLCCMAFYASSGEKVVYNATMCESSLIHTMFNDGNYYAVIIIK